MKIKARLNSSYGFVERPNGVWYFDINADFYGWGLDEDDHKLLPLSNFLEALHDGDGESELICLDTVPRNGINEIMYDSETVALTDNFIVIKVIIF